jgi:hypothetical protein
LAPSALQSAFWRPTTPHSTTSSWTTNQRRYSLHLLSFTAGSWVLRSHHLHIISPAGRHINPQIPRPWNLRDTKPGRDWRRRRLPCLALHHQERHLHTHHHRSDPDGAIKPPKTSQSASNAVFTLPAANSHCTRLLTAHSLRTETTLATVARTPAKWQVQRNPPLTAALRRHLHFCRILQLPAI